mmetsp:Transcript_2513/g.4574  ORF Transcript_2513/g.4574 Transcript_2513/m.4574 type:complete len:327 (-) Transcript_2513:1341-2321(-)
MVSWLWLWLSHDDSVGYMLESGGSTGPWSTPGRLAQHPPLDLSPWVQTLEISVYENMPYHLRILSWQHLGLKIATHIAPWTVRMVPLPLPPRMMRMKWSTIPRVTLQTHHEDGDVSSHPYLLSTGYTYDDYGCTYPKWMPREMAEAMPTQIDGHGDPRNMHENGACPMGMLTNEPANEHGPYETLYMTHVFDVHPPPHHGQGWNEPLGPTFEGVPSRCDFGLDDSSRSQQFVWRHDCQCLTYKQLHMPLHRNILTAATCVPHTTHTTHTPVFEPLPFPCHFVFGCQYFHSYSYYYYSCSAMLPHRDPRCLLQYYYPDDSCWVHPDS